MAVVALGTLLFSGPVLAQSVAAAPAAPTFGMPIASSLAVMWSEPSSTGGSAITGYDLQYRTANTSGAFTNGPQNETGLTATITGLAENTAYEVQVRATNSAGDGPWSASGFGSLTPYQFNDGAASRLFISLQDSEPSNQLVVQFSNPGSGSALPGSYILRLDGVSFLLDSASYGTGSNQSSYTIPNANLSWAEGQAVAVSLVAAPPAAPTVTATSADALSVVWTAPTNPPAPITGYDLRYRQSGTTDWTDGPQNVTGLTAAIIGLSANTEYEVQVRATNSDGDGPWSASGTGRTHALPVVSIAAASSSVTEGESGPIHPDRHARCLSDGEPDHRVQRKLRLLGIAGTENERHQRRRFVHVHHHHHQRRRGRTQRLDHGHADSGHGVYHRRVAGQHGHRRRHR